MTETWPVIGVVGEIEKRRKRASEREGPPFFLLLPLFARQKNALYLYLYLFLFHPSPASSVLPFPAASTSGGSPQWSASLIGAPCFVVLWRREKKRRRLSVFSSSFFGFFCAAPRGKNAPSLFPSPSLIASLSSLSLSYLGDVLLHPVVVPIDAIAPDIALLGDEDPGLFVVFVVAEEEEGREKGKRGQSKAEKKENSSLSLCFSFSLSLCSLSLCLSSSSISLTMRSNGIFQKARGEANRRRMTTTAAAACLCLSLDESKKEKSEGKSEGETKSFFLVFFLACYLSRPLVFVFTLLRSFFLSFLSLTLMIISLSLFSLSEGAGWSGVGSGGS